MNNTELLIKKAQVARQVSEYMGDNPLDINVEQLHYFENYVTELMIECELSNTSDNIANIVNVLAEDKHFDFI